MVRPLAPLEEAEGARVAEKAWALDAPSKVRPGLMGAEVEAPMVLWMVQAVGREAPLSKVGFWRMGPLGQGGGVEVRGGEGLAGGFWYCRGVVVTAMMMMMIIVTTRIMMTKAMMMATATGAGDGDEWENVYI